MEENSPILEKLSELEKEVSGLCNRLEPLMISTPPENPATTQPVRSPVHLQINNMIEQLRSVRSRLEV